MRAVGRVIVALIGFMLAAFAAALFLMFASLGQAPAGNVADAAFYWTQFALGLGLATSLLASASLVPAFVAIFVAEVFRLRSIVYYLAVGTILALAGILGLSSRLPAAGIGSPRATLLVAAGVVGGAAYWLVAGRTAGLTPRHEAPSTERDKI